MAAWGKLTTTVRAVPAAVRLLRQIDNRSFWIAIVASTTQGVLVPVAALVAKLIIDHIVDGAGWSPRLWLLIGLQGGVVVAIRGAGELAEFANSMIREGSRHRLRLKLMEHVASLDLAFLERPENHDQIVKVRDQAHFRPAVLVFQLFRALEQAATVVGFFAVILVFEPILAVALVIGVIPALVVSQQRGVMIHSLHDKETPQGRRGAYFDHLLTQRETAQELRLFDFAKAAIGWNRSYADEALGRRVDVERTAARRQAAATAASVLIQYGALGWVAYLAVDGRVSVGDFTLLVAALDRVRAGLGSIMSQLGHSYEHVLFLSDYDALMAHRAKIVAPNDPAPVPDTIDEIRCEGITFAYPGSDTPVFEGFDLTLRRGEATALVGVNGAGKTTLVKLLTRLYDPDEGRITVDGRDIRDFDPKEYRRRFGVVLQHFGRYELTVSENIAVRLEADADDAVKHAANQAGATQMVAGLSQGWETVLGRAFEPTGQDLSEGQWQSIALARAIHRDAPVLVFDEPTAALDPEAEAVVIERYTSIVRDRLSLMITHRFNTVRTADRILVLVEGHILEDGGHADLVAAGGTYARMFEAQAQHYR